jgi:Putative auto-transporter adhesin, head GIN domain
MHRLIACVCLAAAGMACNHYHDGASSTGPSGILVGSGRLITEERPVNGFRSIAVSGAVRAVVTVGGTESLQITAEDNIAPVVEVVVAGGRLTIGIRPGTPGISSSLGVECRIGARTIRDIEMSGASRIEVDGIDAPELSIRLSGASSFTGSGSVDRLRMELSGASRFTAPSLRALATDSTLPGASVALVRVADALTVHASGASVFEYLGDPALQTDASGASVVRRVGS